MPEQFCISGRAPLAIKLTDTKRYMYDLRREIRFVDVSDYAVAGEDALCGFIKGAIAGGYDNEYVFIDGVLRAHPLRVLRLSC